MNVVQCGCYLRAHTAQNGKKEHEIVENQLQENKLENYVEKNIFRVPDHQ